MQCCGIRGGGLTVAMLGMNAERERSGCNDGGSNRSLIAILRSTDSRARRTAEICDVLDGSLSGDATSP